MGNPDRPHEANIPEDVLPYLDWGRVLAYCMSDTSLNPDSRDRMRVGIERLRDLLGDDFPRRAWQRRLPLVDAFIMSGPMYRRFLAARGYTFWALKEMEGFDRLLDQFQDPDRDKQAEAVAVADLGSRLQHVGVLMAFERPLSYSPRSPRPDLRLTMPGEEVAHLEVSLLGDSQAWEDSNLAASEVTKALFFGPGELKGCVRLERTPSARHIVQLVEEIKSVRQSAISTGGFHCIDRPGTIRLGVSGPRGLPDLERWASSLGMEVNTGCGADVEEDFAKRVASKVRYEQDQLPEDGTGILVVPITKVTFSAGELLPRLGDIEEEVYKYPHVAVLVLQWTVHDLTSALEPSAMPPTESSELLVQDFPRHQILVWNKFPGQPLSQRGKALLRGALSLKPEIERLGTERLGS